MHLATALPWVCLHGLHQLLELQQLLLQGEQLLLLLLLPQL